MTLNRRRLLTGAVAAPLALGLRPAWGLGSPRVFVSACGDAAGRFSVRTVAADGRLFAERALPGRGHAATRRPGHNEVIVVARRPGRFMLAIDPFAGTVSRQVEAAPGRHFYGHAAFSPDGRWLFATENAYAEGRGVVGVYDAAAGYRRARELPSHGIGPHELALLSDGRRLVVANGGIRTHPESGRRKLNLETMRPNLAYVDADSGALLRRLTLAGDLHRLSIRHMAVTPDDHVCLALQNEGPRDRLVPLVGRQRGDAPIVLMSGPEDRLRSMRHYAGGAALDDGGGVLAVSAPRGGLVSFWSPQEGRWLGSLEVPDGCGLAAAGGAGRFAVSSGAGRLLIHDAFSGRTETLRDDGPSGLAWDNHLLAV